MPQKRLLAALPDAVARGDGPCSTSCIDEPEVAQPRYSMAGREDTVLACCDESLACRAQQRPVPIVITGICHAVFDACRGYVPSCILAGESDACRSVAGLADMEFSISMGKSTRSTPTSLEGVRSCLTVSSPCRSVEARRREPLLVPSKSAWRPVPQVGAPAFPSFAVFRVVSHRDRLRELSWSACNHRFCNYAGEVTAPQVGEAAQATAGDDGEPRDPQLDAYDKQRAIAHEKGDFASWTALITIAERLVR